MVTKIDMFGATKLTLAAHAQFNELVAGQIAASYLEALHLTVLAPQYLAAVATEKEAVNRPSAYADTLYRTLVETVNAFAIAIPSAAIETFAVSINALITQYEMVAANQGKKQTTVVQ